VTTIIDGTEVEMLHRSPNHAIGQRGIVTEASPTGHKNSGLYWVDYGEPIQWSFGQSDSTGEWCGPGEFRVIEGEQS
jgi:hypothetical protein